MNRRRAAVRDWVTLDDPRAVQVLINFESSRYLQPFIGHECSAGEAARALDVRLDTMLYQIKRLMHLQLLRHSRTVRRGRLVKLYRAVADGFVLPFSALPVASLFDLFEQQDAPNRRALGRGLVQTMSGGEGGWHLRVYWNAPERCVKWDAVPDSDPDWEQEDLLTADEPAAWLTTQRLWLSPAQAKAVQRELAALYRRCAASTPEAGDDKRAYILQLAMGSLAKEDTPPAPRF